MVQNPNVTHLKHAIDSGKTGDKAPGFDPAAAPLGTDEEAGGYSPTTDEVRQAMAAETRNPHTRTPNAVDPSLAPSGGQPSKWGWWIGGLIVAVIAIVVIVMMIGR